MDIGTAIFLMAIVGLVVWRISTLISGNRRYTSYGGVHSTSPTAPTPASPSTVKVLLGHLNGRKYLLILGGVAGVLVIIVLLVMFMKDDVAKITQGADAKFVAATLIVIALAVLGAMGKAGGPGKWALSIVAILAILFFLSEMIIRVGYGDQADAVKQAMTDRRVNAILNPSKPTVETVVQAPQVRATALRQVVTLQLKAGQAKPLRVTGDQCILWWGADPDGHAFSTEARHEILPPWRSWEEWQKLRAAGKVGNPGWLRFTATHGDAEVNYELRRDGEC